MKFLISLLLCFSFIDFSYKLYAEGEKGGDAVLMRHCLLLPILDDQEGTFSSQIYTQVEDILKNASWCRYTPNSDIYSILQNYRTNLPHYIRTPEILQSASNRTHAGSLILITITTKVSPELLLEIYAADGQSVYYREKIPLASLDTETLIDLIYKQLEAYRKFIPYDGEVSAIAGEQVIINTGRYYRVQLGQSFFIKRLVKIVTHPLLQKIISFESQVIAKGEVVSIGEDHFVGIIKEVMGERLIQKGDWATLEMLTSQEGKSYRDNFELPRKTKGFEFGKIGEAGIGVTLNSQSFSNNYLGKDRTSGGFSGGLIGKGELWPLRFCFVGGEILQEVATLKAQDGPYTVKSYNGSESRYKIVGGYRYFFMDFFYAPRVDFYLGIVQSSYSFKKVVADGVGGLSLGGLLVGVKGDLPLYRVYRFYAKAELILLSWYSDKDLYTKGAKKERGGRSEIELGGRYVWDERTNLDLSIEITRSFADFSDGDEWQLSENRLKAGLFFTF